MYFAYYFTSSETGGGCEDDNLSVSYTMPNLHDIGNTTRKHSTPDAAYSKGAPLSSDNVDNCSGDNYFKPYEEAGDKNGTTCCKTNCVEDQPGLCITGTRVNIYNPHEDLKVKL